ncbi:glycosyltransferase family 2 protein [Synechococcus sp. CBW1002]|uniref:glycosyltransferase family 2 protein n=1 Tax=Synechococcus sp. CBW1002 TaxID=1353134 RepID=UPI0018CFCD1A|nr:glycosyltransferase family 2 protein [Synechococcus sp. CBW1002]QPN59092.1 glycosyltransferase family 2 protein [Synechococcus sp. CBW1002]
MELETPLLAGRLFGSQGHWPEAALWLSNAQLGPTPDSSAEKLAWLAQNLAALEGEEQRRGLQEQSYVHWIRQAEPRLEDPLRPLNQEWWLRNPGQAQWVGLHAACGPLPVPQDQRDPHVWPTQGWLVLLAADARLRRGALQSLERWLSALPPEGLPDLIYADEDRLDAEGRRQDPWFKPDWVEESFWSTPWLEGFSCWNLAWLRHGELSLPPEDPTGRFRWMLQALELEPRVGHMPEILVHRQGEPTPHETSARSPLLRAHLQRRGEAVEAVESHPELPDAYQLRWSLPAGHHCSVIIPTRDRADLLADCLHTVERARAAVADRLVVEVLVVDNGSQEEDTAALLQQWQQRLGPALRVLRREEPFNWSCLNNAAAAEARGDLLLFLNNDVECRPDDARQNDGWLGWMAAQALRERVGCSGALLLYEDGTLQHGGVVVGMHGVADHAYRYLPLDHGVHRGRSRCHTAWGAVTGGCLMVRRDLFDRLGGFDEGLPVEGNDVDFCLRLGQLGYRHVIDPRVLLSHYESQSRNAHASPTADDAYRRMRGRWLARLGRAEPWWPPSCSRDHPDGRPNGLDFLV